MERRTFLAMVSGSLLAAPLAAEAQSAPGRVYRIGVLSLDYPPPGLFEAFQERLRELGYVEGKNVAIESRHPGVKNERLAALADELIRLKVDVILAINTAAVQAAKKATTSIPIVMTRVADPVKSGLVASISRPGGNITGLSFLPEVLSGKQLELLKEALPGVSRVAALWYAGNPGSVITVKGMEDAGAQLGLQLLKLSVQGPNDFLSAVETAARGRAEALVVVDDAMVTRYRVEIVIWRGSTRCLSFRSTSHLPRPAASSHMGRARLRCIGTRQTTWTRSSGGRGPVISPFSNQRSLISSSISRPPRPYG